jgi:hypothetical protein
MLSGQPCNHWGFSRRLAKICLIPWGGLIAGQWMKAELSGLSCFGIKLGREKAAII